MPVEKEFLDVKISLSKIMSFPTLFFHSDPNNLAIVFQLELEHTGLTEVLFLPLKL